MQDHITDLTGGLETGLTNYNVAASVLPLDDQHSCYSFTQDVFEIAGGEGRVIDKFSQSELDKIVDFDGNPAKILIETVHGDLPKIPQRAVEKARDAVTNGIESGIENLQEKTGVGGRHEENSDQEASLLPTDAPVQGASLEDAINQTGSTPPFLPFGQAVQQFAKNRELLRASDPEASLPVTQAANHPEAEAMLVRLNDAGIEQFPSDTLKADTPEDRVGNILIKAQEIDKILDAERVFEQVHSNIKTSTAHEYEHDYSFGD